MKPICMGYKPDASKPCVHTLYDAQNQPSLCGLQHYFRCVEWIRRQEFTLSYSSLKDCYCWRKFYYAYIRGLEIKEKPFPMLMGTIADKYLQHIHGDTPLDINWVQYQDDQGELPAPFAMLQALMTAYAESTEIKGKAQVEGYWWEPDHPRLKGFVDLIQLDTIAYEFKYTSRPDIYSKKFAVQDQAMSYFLILPKLERITFRAFQVPQLRKGKNENIDSLQKRVMADFKARPRHYINDTNFWREEFNYTEFKAKLQMVRDEIREKINMGEGRDDFYGFYQNNGPTTCYGDTTGVATMNCQYLDICTTGVISDQIYRCRGGEKKNGEMAGHGITNSGGEEGAGEKGAIDLTDDAAREVLDL